MNYYLQLLSKHRSALMGIAIILIMICHCGVLSIGRIGVETFILLSGVGCFFSLNKNDSPKVFYRKRLLRIFPTYLILATPIIWYYDHQWGWMRIIADLTTINILRGGRFYWFILLIFISYLAAPFYFGLIKKVRCPMLIPVVFMAGAFILSKLLPTQSIWMERIPSFLLGMNFGQLIIEGKQTKTSYLGNIIVFILGCLLLLALASIETIVSGEEMRVLFFFTVPIVLFAIGVALDYINTTLIYICLSYIGTVTLELYILHELVFKPISEWMVNYLWLQIPLGIVIAIFASFFVNRLISGLLNKYKIQ